MRQNGSPILKITQVDAILDGTFYIHTHQNHRKAVEERMRAILDGKAPAMPEEGHEVFGK